MKIRITPSYVYLALSLSQVIAAGHVGSQQREDDYVPRGLDDIEQEEVLAQRIRDEEGLKLREGGQDGKVSRVAVSSSTSCFADLGTYLLHQHRRLARDWTTGSKEGPSHSTAMSTGASTPSSLRLMRLTRPKQKRKLLRKR